MPRWVPRGMAKRPTGRVRKVQKAVKTYVKRALDRNIEDKYLLQDLAEVRPLRMTYSTAMVGTGVTPETTGLFLLNAPATGVLGTNGRLGDKIKVTGFEVRMAFTPCDPLTPFANSVIDHGCVRIIVFICKSPEGLIPAPVDFQVVSAGQGVDRPMHPNLKQTNTLLYDKLHYVRAFGNITTQTHTERVVIKRKFKRPFFTYFYSGAGATSSWDTIKTNALAVCVIAAPDGHAGGATLGTLSNVALVDIQTKCTYEDA